MAPPNSNSEAQTHERAALQRWSCHTCRLKKIRCDRRTPCGSCSRSQGSLCVFPTHRQSGRTRPKRTKNRREADNRLDELERVVDLLSEELAHKGEMNMEGHSPVHRNHRNISPPLINNESEIESTTYRTYDRSLFIPNDTARSPDSIARSRHASEPHAPLSAEALVSHGVPISVQFRPQSSDIDILWKIYQRNVEPIVKILHVPTTNALINQVKLTPSQTDLDFNALILAICYAAIISMSNSEVLACVGGQKSHILCQYRRALEEALIGSNGLQRPSLVVVQAFVLFLTTARQQETSRSCWSLIALVIRIAQNLDIHRDGIQLGLSPFETEMRRRIWWIICILDLQFSEELGMDLAIPPGSFDTEMPSNINDSDMTPEMNVMPTAREGRSDCTIARVKAEFCALWRRLFVVNSNMAAMSPADIWLAPAEWERLVVNLYHRMQGQFLKRPLLEHDPLFQMVTILLRTVTTKMVLAIYQPRFCDTADTDEGTRRKFWLTAIEVVESHHNLKKNIECRQWRWVFETHMPWNAVAYILRESLHRPWLPASERAWELAENALGSEESDMTDNCVHVPLSALYAETAKHREAEIDRLRENAAAVSQLDTEESMCFQPICLDPHNVAGDRISRVRDRWRQAISRTGPFSQTPCETPTTSETSEGAVLLASLLSSVPQPILCSELEADLFVQVIAPLAGFREA